MHKLVSLKEFIFQNDRQMLNETSLWFSAIFWWHMELQGAPWIKGLTCSQEHNFILSILCRNPVHHNLSQGVVHSDTRENRSSGQRVDRAMHERVKSNETDHLVWEVFGGLDPCIVGLAGTLMETIKKDDSHLNGIREYFPTFIVPMSFSLNKCVLYFLLHVALWWWNIEQQVANQIRYTRASCSLSFLVDVV